jgi:hypothetical protein
VNDRATNPLSDSYSAFVPGEIYPSTILADVSAAPQYVLPFPRVDHPVAECTSGGGVLSAKLDACRSAALPSRQISLFASALGFSQDELTGHMSVLSSEGA